jgi:hypothetical protein
LKTSGAESLAEKKGFIAALKALHPITPKAVVMGTPALRHPKSSFSANCKATIDSTQLTARLKPCPFKAYSN